MGVRGDLSMYDDIYRICRGVIENLKSKYGFRYRYDGYKFCIVGIKKKQFICVLDEYRNELKSIGLKSCMVIPLVWDWRKRY